MAHSQPARGPEEPSPVLALRFVVLASAASLVIVFAVLWLLGLDVARVATAWMVIPLVLGLADLVLIPAVGSTVRPLPHGVDAAHARRVSAGVLRTVTFLRLGLAEAPALAGLVFSFLTGSLVPYAIGLCFAVPLLLVRAYPNASAIAVLRRRLESGGVTSYL